MKEDYYKPGACNIGREEVNVRKKRFATSLIAVIVFTYFCFDRPESSWMRSFLFISVSACAIMYMQVRYRFCARFGMTGYFNFGKPGKSEKITDKNDLKKDRQKVLKMVLISFLFACLFILLVSFLSKLL